MVKRRPDFKILQNRLVLISNIMPIYRRAETEDYYSPDLSLYLHYGRGQLSDTRAPPHPDPKGNQKQKRPFLFILRSLRHFVRYDFSRHTGGHKQRMVRPFGTGCRRGARMAGEKSVSGSRFFLSGRFYY